MSPSPALSSSPDLSSSSLLCHHHPLLCHHHPCSVIMSPSRSVIINVPALLRSYTKHQFVHLLRPVIKSQSLFSILSFSTIHSGHWAHCAVPSTLPLSPAYTSNASKKSPSKGPSEKLSLLDSIILITASGEHFLTFCDESRVRSHGRSHHSLEWGTCRQCSPHLQAIAPACQLSMATLTAQIVRGSLLSIS